MRNCLSNSNFRTCGARNARSFKFSMFSRSSRRSMLARDFNARLTEHYGDMSLCVCNLFLSGYRGLSCFAEHSSDRIPDHFQAPSPLLKFLGCFHVQKPSSGVTHEYGSFARERGFFSQGETAHV